MNEEIKDSEKSTGSHREVVLELRGDNFDFGVDKTFLFNRNDVPQREVVLYGFGESVYPLSHLVLLSY